MDDYSKILNSENFSPGFMKRDKGSWLFSIEIPLLPFVSYEENIVTRLSMDNVDFKTANLNYLSEKTFEFPSNPDPGYIDASIYLEGTHVFTDVQKISFGKIESHSLMYSARAEFLIDFILEDIGYENISKTIQIDLIIYTDVGSPRY